MQIWQNWVWNVWEKGFFLEASVVTQREVCNVLIYIMFLVHSAKGVWSLKYDAIADFVDKQLSHKSMCVLYYL